MSILHEVIRMVLSLFLFTIYQMDKMKGSGSDKTYGGPGIVQFM